MRKLIMLTTLAGLAAAIALTAMPAAAKPRGANGQIAFARFDATLGDQVPYTINPDGTHQRQISTPIVTGELPRWSPDGTRLAILCCNEISVALIVNPDTGSTVSLPNMDPDLFYGCNVWSPDGTHLACEAGFIDPSRQGIYTIRSSDGGALTQITSNPGRRRHPGQLLARRQTPRLHSPEPGRQPDARHRQARRDGAATAHADRDGHPVRNRRLVAAGKRDPVLRPCHCRRVPNALGRSLRRQRTAPALDRRLRRPVHRPERTRLPRPHLVARRPEDRLQPLQRSDRTTRDLHRQRGRHRPVPGHTRCLNRARRRCRSPELGHAPAGRIALAETPWSAAVPSSRNGGE